MHLGDESSNASDLPTMADANGSGSYDLSGSGLAVSSGESVAFWLESTFAGTPVESQANSLARTWAHVTPWIRPVWMTSWEFLAAVLARSEEHTSELQSLRRISY